MLIAIVLDRPLVEAKALVEAPDAFIQAITRIMQDKQNHPVIAQMIRPGINDDLPPSESAASSSGGRSHRVPCTATYALPISASGQREVLTVPPTKTGTRAILTNAIGVPGQHEVLGRTTFGVQKANVFTAPKMRLLQ